MRVRPGQARPKGNERKKISSRTLLAKETMGNSTLDIGKINAQSIKFGNRKKMKLSEA